jgi:nicotinate-nucleotide adenylyltransferase
MSGRIGVFGGTFDPIHIGHLAAVQDAADILGLDRVLFVPNRQPPHKEGSLVSPTHDRVAMVQLSVEGNAVFELSAVELERPGPSYTLDTMRDLRGRLGPQTHLVFLSGCDALANLHSWHEPETLLDEFQVVIMDRPTGHEVSWPAIEQYFPDIRRQVEVVHVVQLEISAEEIRRRVRTGRSIKYYVVPAVEAYIHEHGLYLRPHAGGAQDVVETVTRDQSPRTVV